MSNLSNLEKKKLKSIAHNYKPVVMVGQNGVTDNLIDAMEKALYAHELVKVKFNSFKDEKREISIDIEKKTSSKLVGIIGNVATYFKQNPDEEKRKINL